MGPVTVTLLLTVIFGARVLAGSAEIPPDQANPPAWQVQGDRVVSAYEAYRERLDRLHKALGELLRNEAPDLLPKVMAAAPKPVPHGYQVLPRLVANDPPPTTPPRATVTSYSWPRTERLIEEQLRKIEGLETELSGLAAQPSNRKRAACVRLAGDYPSLQSAHHLIDAHIQYNRLWQKAVAGDRAGYDRQTSLLRAVEERQAILDALGAADDASFHNHLGAIRGVDRRKPRAEMVGDLRARMTEIERQVQSATDGDGSSAAGVRVEHPDDRHWILHVTVGTDIQDTDFLRAFKKGVEEVWRVVDGPDEFRLEISLDRISTRRLYRGSGLTRPRPGTSIDLASHCALFPAGAAVLTTGAGSTHVVSRRCIVLGPHDISPHTLAHEFGHVLGFRDVYFRGYRDLAEGGFEVLEVVAEPDDIMGAPGTGPVRRSHFEKLIAAARPEWTARLEFSDRRSGKRLRRRIHRPAAVEIAFIANAAWCSSARP